MSRSNFTVLLTLYQSVSSTSVSLNNHLRISKKSLLSVFTEVLVKEHPFLLGIILILSRILPGCQTYSVLRSKRSYFRQKSTNGRRSVCAHVWGQEGAGRGRVRVTIMMMFRFIWVHFLSLLLLYLNITPPHFFFLTSLSFTQVTYIINVMKMKRICDYWGLASVELERETASFWQL